MRFQKTILLLGMLSLIQATHAEDLFSAQITIDDQTIQYQSYDKILDLAAQFKTSQLKALAPHYTNNSFVSSQVQYLGLNDIHIQFNENSNTLILDIPSANIHEEFNGATRSKSRTMMVDYLKKAPEEFTEALVKSSAHHPVNQARSINTYTAYDNSIIATDLMPQTNQNAQNTTFDSALTIAPRFGRYTQGNIDTDVITLPLTYAKWLANQNFMLVVDLPLTVSQTKDAIAGQGSLGIGINSAVTDNWYLMPNIRVGATISPDIGTASSLFGSGLSSNYQYHLSESARLNLINILSYYKTASLKIKDYHTKYDLDNFVYRNGIEYTQALNGGLFGRTAVLKAHVARTDYTGDAVFSKYSHDVGVSIGLKNPNAHSLFQDLRVGFNYQQGDRDTEGFSINAGYTF